MYRSSLFTKLFLLLLFACAMFFVGTYYYAIPLIDQRIYGIEVRAGKTSLNNLYSLLKQSKQDVAAWEQYSLNSHKNNLKNLINIADKLLHSIYVRYSEHKLTMQQARAEAIAIISNFRYDKNNYLYLLDYNGTFIYHPDPKLNGNNGIDICDINGKKVVAPIIDKARAAGAAFHDYWWRRLGADKPSHKLSFSKNLPEWGWVIGSGTYLDDIAVESKQRRDQMILFLREYIRNSRIATNGYMYIFDGDLNMVIHPNANIEGTNFRTLKDPITNKSIGEELIAAAHSDNHSLVYMWDKPSDPGHYIYKKIAWVRYLSEYDYYVASSVYLDDLSSSGHLLAVRLLQVTAVTAISLLGIGMLLIMSISTAIKKLASTANCIVDGNLDIKADIRRSDEIGKLADSFNQMVDKLREQIDLLEERVTLRTTTLTATVEQLEQNSEESQVLRQANEMLQACRNEQEANEAIRIIMQKAFTANHGALFSLVYEGKKLQIGAEWNGDMATDTYFNHDACIGLRHGSTYVMTSLEQQLPCPHLGNNLSCISICVPVTAYGETFGILHQQLPQNSDENSVKRTLRMMEHISEYLANTVANLRLRARLQQQSVRDPLTGLFNRRYMDEALKLEESRALRNASQLAIMMLDVDHFKNFNDNYGHEIGDEALRQLGKLLRKYFRESDVPCRYGGEEFLIIMPNATLEQCHDKAEQLRSAVAGQLKVFHNGETIGITISIGVALFPQHGSHIHAAIKQADKALYRAKEQGRNRVVSAE